MPVLDFNTDPFAGIRKGGPGTGSTNQMQAPQLGYMKGPGKAFSGKGGLGGTPFNMNTNASTPTPPSYLDGSSAMPNGGAPGSAQQPNGGMIGQLTDAATQDLKAAEDAQNFNQGRVDSTLSQMQNLFGKSGAISDNAKQGAANLNRMGADANALGDKQTGEFNAFSQDTINQTNAGVNKLNGQLDASNGRISGVQNDLDAISKGVGGTASDVNAAYGYADQAIAQAKQNKAEQMDLRAQNIASAVQGLKGRLTTMRSGRNPDGSPMTPEQQADFRQQTQQQVMQQTGQVVTQINQDFNQTMERMGKEITSSMQFASDTHLKGAATKQNAFALQGDLAKSKLAGEQMKQQNNALSLEGTRLSTQTRLTAGQQLLQSQEGRRQSQQLAASLAESAAHLEQSGLLASMNFEAAGLDSMARFIQSNPRSIVSKFAALSQLFKVATAPGAQNQPGLNLGSNA